MYANLNSIKERLEREGIVSEVKYYESNNELAINESYFTWDEITDESDMYYIGITIENNRYAMETHFCNREFLYKYDNQEEYIQNVVDSMNLELDNENLNVSNLDENLLSKAHTLILSSIKLNKKYKFVEDVNLESLLNISKYNDIEDPDSFKKYFEKSLSELGYIMINGYFAKLHGCELKSYIDTLCYNIDNSNSDNCLIESQICELLGFLDERFDFNDDICSCAFRRIDVLTDKLALNMLVSHISSDDTIFNRYSHHLESILKKDTEGTLSSIMYYVAGTEETSLIVNHILNIESKEQREDLILNILTSEGLEYAPIEFIKYLMDNSPEKISNMDDASDLIYRIMDDIKEAKNSENSITLLKTLYQSLDTFCNTKNLRFV